MKTELAVLAVAIVLLWGCTQGTSKANTGTGTPSGANPNAGTGSDSGAGTGSGAGSGTGSGSGSGTVIGAGADGEFNELDSFSASEVDATDPASGIPDFSLDTP